MRAKIASRDRLAKMGRKDPESEDLACEDLESEDRLRPLAEVRLEKEIAKRILLFSMQVGFRIAG